MSTKLDVKDTSFNNTKRFKTLKMPLIEPYIYLLPCFMLFFAFKFYPFLKTIFLSLTLTNSMGEPIKYIGFNNYIDVVKSDEFIKWA